MSEQGTSSGNRAPASMETPAGLPVPRKPRAALTISERYQRLAFAAACKVHEQDVINFWYNTMMDRRADMQHRIVCSRELMNRAHGLPLQITNETVTETRKQILEVRWLPPDPNDRSKLIEPEPD